ncbi:MAG: hydrogenase maturation nickel metallochaperone HypA [Bacteroidota bacterium]
MHELSLVQSIFSTLENELSQEELNKLEAVELNIGLLANVEPILLNNAFKAYQETRNAYLGVELKTNMIPISINCPNCKKTSEIKNYIFICAHCGTPSNQIITGEELLIHRIHYADN